jgi:sugar phosphate isomerase/epimerase
MTTASETHPGERELGFWAGTTFPLGLEARVEAATAGGFSTVSVFPTDCAPPLGPNGVRELVQGHGLRVSALDPYTRWVPRWEPPSDLVADYMGLVGTGEEEFFALAEALGAQSLTALEVFGAEFPIDALVDGFGALCDRAARSGLRVHLEFTPLGGIPDLATAWTIVSGAGRENGGLAFDTWHYFRGRPDDGLLDRIPGDRIFVVQVSDAPATPQTPLPEDTMHHRRLPGDGDWDLTGLLHRLQLKPGIGEFGIEVLSDRLWQLPPAEIGRRCGDTLRRALASPSASR